MRFFSLTVFLILCACARGAQPTEVFLWPNGAPGSEGKTNPLVVITSKSGERSIYRVHRPSITPFLPHKTDAPATAVIVIPGGGHRVLAYDHEGDFVAKALAEDGIAAFVLKYRLARETNSTYSITGHAVPDTQRAIRTVRAREGMECESGSDRRDGIFGGRRVGEFCVAELR